MSKRRITIVELAEELNTTPSTVSRALRGHKGISKGMKERVKELAEKRNYTVNRMAANLRNGTSKILGVVVPRINRDFFSNCISGIEEIASLAGYSIIICQTHDKSEEEKKSVFTLIGSNAAGILISTGSTTDDLDYFNETRRLGIPLIFFDRATKNTAQHKVVVNDELGAYKGVTHLIEQGYQRIAHFAGAQHIKLYQERKKGYLDALRDHDIPVDESLILEGVLKKDEGYEAMTTLMNLPNPPDALFSSSDYSALGGIIKLKEMGIKIPEEMGIVGFSNEMFTSIISPKMTSIDQHSKEIGNCAVKACLEAIDENTQPHAYKNVVIEPTLIVRESSLRNKLRNK
ncbi:MAG TPA: LacI family transcriptional regulator [Phaeodactylibacter sp.]|nr:LacI family transcriptional regulator [Phaeodactylibacter sp.]